MNIYILVVDDEPDVEALFRQQFRRDIRAGRFVMEFAGSAMEALAKAAGIADPSLILILSDINMPRMDGLSLLAKLQEADDKKSTVIVSAYGDMSNIRTAMNRGAFDFLTKPIDFGQVRQEIDARLEPSA